MKRILVVLATLTLWSCDGNKGPSKADFEENLSELDGPAVDISDENIKNIIYSIPSPLEISFLIKDAGIEYNKALLNPESNVSNYNTNNTKALNLGVYGTDLGYTDIYGQHQDGLEYLGSVKNLADDLGIGQFFDFALIRKLTESSDNLDSLLLVTSENYNRINDHFQEQGRSSLSVMLLLGGWLESLHLTCQVALAHPESEQIMERVGEQKIILENMMILLTVYGREDDYINQLQRNLMELKTAYEKVEISYVYEESTSKIIDGVLVIEDNSSSQVHISQDLVTEIAEITERIRKEIIS